MLEELAAKGTRLERMLLQLKWPPPGHLPAALLDDIALAFDRKQFSPEDVEELFVNYYAAHRLREVVQSWHERRLNPRRLRIVEQAVAAHVERRFELSVPTILPQIEGTIAEIFGHVGRLSIKEVRRYLQMAFRRGSRFDKIGAAFFVEVLFDQFQWGSPIPTLSRHAILHGADLEYATAAKSLRLILIFDQLQAAMRYVVSPSGGKYHLPTCSYAGAKGTRSVYDTAAGATDAGYAPCSRCLPYSPDHA
ncbi:MAG: hypothetical protein LC667_01975 [Thioalkalivibrio sp.]|nr:hypothetical protein [Thioalkalivibrio sp.]